MPPPLSAMTRTKDTVPVIIILFPFAPPFPLVPLGPPQTYVCHPSIAAVVCVVFLQNFL